jgi:hypothetical protein
VFVAAGAADAATIDVPARSSRRRNAVAGVAGDEIVLRPGVYRERRRRPAAVPSRRAGRGDRQRRRGTSSCHARTDDRPRLTVRQRRQPAAEDAGVKLECELHGRGRRRPRQLFGVMARTARRRDLRDHIVGLDLPLPRRRRHPRQDGRARSSRATRWNARAISRSGSPTLRRAAASSAARCSLHYMYRDDNVFRTTCSTAHTGGAIMYSAA